MQTTRRRILSLLERRHLATVAELGRILGMTAANIRYHLRRLQQDGLVEIVGRHPSPGRGRPELVYGLALGTQGQNLPHLINALWQIYIGDVPSKTRHVRLRRLAVHLAGSGQMAGRGNLTQRLFQTVRRLRKLNYAARWEAHAEAPRIILERCPYAAVQGQHPDICKLDEQVIELLLGQPVRQLSTRSRRPGGSPHCVFCLDTSKG